MLYVWVFLPQDGCSSSFQRLLKFLIVFDQFFLPYVHGITLIWRVLWELLCGNSYLCDIGNVDSKTLLYWKSERIWANLTALKPMDIGWNHLWRWFISKRTSVYALMGGHVLFVAAERDRNNRIRAESWLRTPYFARKGYIICSLHAAHAVARSTTTTWWWRMVYGWDGHVEVARKTASGCEWIMF